MVAIGRRDGGAACDNHGPFTLLPVGGEVDR